MKRGLLLALAAIFLLSGAITSVADPEPSPDLSGDEVASAYNGLFLGRGSASREETARDLSSAASGLSADLFTGTLSTNYVIKLPAGRNGAAPSLSLTYRSGRKSDLLGPGWGLSTSSYIRLERSPENANADVLVLGDAHNGVELIETNTQGIFLPRNGSSYGKVEKRVLATGAIYWVATDRMGRESTFGSLPESRRLATKFSTQPIEWWIESTKDLFGNIVEYRNECVDKSAQTTTGCLDSLIRPSSINYSSNKRVGLPASVCIEFKYAQRSSPPYSISIHDTPRPILSLLSEVIVRGDAKGCLNHTAGVIGRYTLQYVESPSTADKLLSTVIQSDVNGTPLPWHPTFSYAVSNFAVAPLAKAPALRTTDDFGAPTLFSHLNKLQVAYTDFNGDGLLDLCAFGANEGGGGFFNACVPGQTNGTFDVEKKVETPVMLGGLQLAGVGPPYVLGVQYPDLNGDGRSDICALADHGSLGIAMSCWLRFDDIFSKRYSTPIFWPRPNYKNQRDVEFFATRFLTTVRFPDIDGDGAADICFRRTSDLECHLTDAKESGSDIAFKKLEETMPFSGGEFAPQPMQMVDMGDLYFSSIQFVDLNNDGKADICARGKTGLSCFLRSNKGFDISFLGPLWADAPQSPPDSSSSSTIPESAPTEWQRVDHWQTIRYGDINGDHLLDVCGRDKTGMICHLNAGTAFDNEAIIGPLWGDPPPTSTDSTPISVSQKPKSTDWTNKDYFSTIVLVDMDGDSVSDICARIIDHFLCYRANRKGFDATPFVNVDPTNGVPQNYRQLTLLDVDSDGFPDVCTVSSSGLNCLQQVNPRLAPADFLIGLDNGLGRVTEAYYMPSAGFFGNRIPFTYFAVVRIETKTTSMIVTDDGAATTTTVGLRKDIVYSNGYFHVRTRDFRGFQDVTETVVPISQPSAKRISRQVFNQGRLGIDLNGNTIFEKNSAMTGLTNRVTIMESETKPFRIVETDYEPTTSPPFFAPVKEVRETICSTSSCTDSPTIVKFKSDEFGNLIHETHYGDSATSSDDFTIVRKFLIDKSLWILGLPVSEVTYRGSGTLKIAAKTETFYDDVAPQCVSLSLSSPQGQLTLGRPTRIQRWNDKGADLQWIMQYDNTGNVTCSSAPGASPTKYEYDSDTRIYVSKSVDPIGATSTNQYFGLDGLNVNHGVYGLLSENKDINGVVTSSQYDTYGRITKRVNADGTSFALQYIDFGIVQSQRIETTQSDGIKYIAWIDGTGHTWREQIIAGARPSISRFFQFDEFGALTRSSIPEFDSSPKRSWTHINYDKLGRISRSVTPSGATIDNCFSGRKFSTVNPAGLTTLLEIDPFGRTKSASVFTSDHGRPSCTTSPGTPYSKVQFEYDELGRTIAIRDAKNLLISTEYDSVGRVVKQKSMVNGVFQTSYDAAGRVESRSGPSGSIFFAYDKVDRIIQKDFGRRKAVGTGDVIYKYDEGFGNNGRLTTVSMKNWEAKYKYDPVGRITESKQMIDGVQYRVGYSYIEGKLQELTYPDGYKIKYQYGADNNLESITDDHDLPLISFSSYNATGAPQSIKYGAIAELEQQYHDNTAASNCGELNWYICSQTLKMKASATTPPGVLVDTSFSYDIAGNPTTVASNLLGRGSRTFNYDQLGRVSAAEDEASTLKVSYSPEGNPASFEMNGKGQQLEFQEGIGSGAPYALTKFGDFSFVYDEIGRLRSRSKLNAAGNQKTTSTQNFTYNDTGTLSSIKGPEINESYGYDALGRRVWRANGVRREHYVSGIYQCSLVGAGVKSCERQVFLGDQLLATVGDKREVEYTYFSPSRDTRISFSAFSGKSKTTSYDAFGKPRTSTSTAGPTIRSGLQQDYFDPSTNLYYIGARYYDPSIGRFIAPDPLFTSANGTEGFNPYTYALNNPVSNWDPDGEFGWVAVLVGAAIGALMAGEASNWELGEMLRGAMIGALAGAVGSWTAGLLPVGSSPILVSAVGGAAGSATSALAYGQDPAKAAAIGFVAGGYGEAFSTALGPAAGGMIGGAVGASLYGGDLWSGVRWGYYSSMVSQLVVSNSVMPEKGDIVIKNDTKLAANTAYAMKPGDLFGKLWTLLLAEPYSHVMLTDENGMIHDATVGARSGEVRQISHYKDRVVTPMGKVLAPFNAQIGSGMEYGFGRNQAVCTQYLQISSAGQFRGILPSQQFYGSNGAGPARNYYWARSPYDL